MEQPTDEKRGREVTKLYVLSPLINFASDSAEIKLSENLTITLPSNEEKRIIKEDSSSSVLSHLRVLYEWQFVIRSVIHLRMEEDQLAEDNHDFQSGPYRCCTALRLLKEGTVRLGPQYLIVYPPLKLVTKLGRANTFSYDTWGKYCLAIDEVPQFKELYSLVSHLDSPKYQKIKVALLRFDFSYNIGLLYQLIDLMIAFEALYIADDKELGYKMAARSSFLLGETPEQRNRIFLILKKAYDLRGKVVHGGDLPDRIEISKGSQLSSLEFASEIRGFLRHSIKRFIKLLDSYSHKQLLETYLDRNIMSGGSLLKQ